MANEDCPNRKSVDTLIHLKEDKEVILEININAPYKDVSVFTITLDGKPVNEEFPLKLGNSNLLINKTLNIVTDTTKTTPTSDPAKIIYTFSSGVKNPDDQPICRQQNAEQGDDIDFSATFNFKQ